MHKGVLYIEVFQRRGEPLDGFCLHVFVFLIALVKNKAHSVLSLPAEAASQLRDCLVKRGGEGLKILFGRDLFRVIRQQVLPVTTENCRYPDYSFTGTSATLTQARTANADHNFV